MTADNLHCLYFAKKIKVCCFSYYYIIYNKMSFVCKLKNKTLCHFFLNKSGVTVNPLTYLLYSFDSTPNR